MEAVMVCRRRSGALAAYREREPWWSASLDLPRSHDLGQLAEELADRFDADGHTVRVEPV
jgi:hypothetical protein